MQPMSRSGWVRGSRRSSVVSMSGTVTGNLIRLVLSGAERQGADPRVLVREATEFALGTLLRRARHAAGRPVTPLQIQFQGQAPRSHGDLARAFGTRRIDFGAGISAMAFGRADLDLPLRRADPALARILRRAGDAQLAKPERVPRWIDRFRQVLGECLDDQAMLLSAAARRLHVSPRALQRLLEREGTSWRSEADAARREQAARLQRTGAARSQVASRLGYSDARALRRAARRWERE